MRDGLQFQHLEVQKEKVVVRDLSLSVSLTTRYSLVITSASMSTGFFTGEYFNTTKKLKCTSSSHA